MKSPYVASLSVTPSLSSQRTSPLKTQESNRILHNNRLTHFAVIKLPRIKLTWLNKTRLNDLNHSTTQCPTSTSKIPRQEHLELLLTNFTLLYSYNKMDA